MRPVHGHNSAHDLFDRSWRREPVRKLREAVFAVVTALGFSSYATGEVAYGDGVGSPDGKYSAIYLGSAIRIEENPAGDNPVRIGAFPVYTLNWTGDSHTAVVTEHLAGGSQVTLIYLDDGAWKRIEIDPIDDCDDAAVVALEVRDHSVTVTYKLRWRHNEDFQFRLNSFDIDTITRDRSNETVKKITAAQYDKLGNWPTKASIRIAYPRQSE